MVRTIDKVERRQVLAEAVWRIIRRDGFDAASVRAVAAEASLSTGSVRHFFATQDELHVFAMEELVAHMTGKVRQVLDSAWSNIGAEPGWTPAGARQAVTAVLLELLPLTHERAELFIAHLQFITKATVHPVLRPTARRLADETQQLVEHLVRSLVETGAARADLDVRASSMALASLLDGITLRRLTAPQTLSGEDAVKVVEGCLDSWKESA